MSAAKFTPGPWLVQKRKSEKGCIHHVIGLNDLGPVAGVGGVRGDRYMLVSGMIDEHDAALIAAAPDLYAALDAAMPFLLSHQNDAGMARYDLAAAALAKARGET